MNYLSLLELLLRQTRLPPLGKLHYFNASLGSFCLSGNCNTSTSLSTEAEAHITS
jgi:hypothetical protein